MMKKLTCHCGGVEAEVSLPSGLKNVRLLLYDIDKALKGLDL